ncbi:DUF4266 domain-containing protein [Ketobacter sp. MCCC 1A13808]|uniref:DUF4266 domain-containing protein n=1 Tax=Ketobacter sp. MCCC 1A13808 TaxID=2602738 RepID=UPI000F20B8B9|nr:DUF4266 domain-containing protein [Ketobacter sp. MCCC 1A13808]MVF13337.1 DUF4266 domain-containing protein [Ketobacter sp. MCCC 1A13808]RLP54323.1 MAG: DUF4266 domain-containing protein [Ketobacter sp.]
MKKPIAVCMLILAFGAITGCETVKPWVKPYERNNLADPIMSFGRDPIESSFMHHVYQAREGARGAEGGGGGGCGCN